MILLEQAKELIRDPAHFHQGYYYANADGENTDDHEKACKRCAIGALQTVEYKTNGYYIGDNQPILVGAAKAMLIEEGYDLNNLTRPDGAIKLNAVVFVNDVLGHEKVMQMFDRAIALAKE